MPVEAAVVLLDRHEDQVFSMIEDGTLAWAWDIRSQTAERREVRIWRISLLECMAGLPTTGNIHLSARADEDTVLADLFPHSRAIVRSTELQRMFSCSGTHILDLVREGHLVATNKYKTGPNNSAQITRESVLALLKSRRVV